MVKLEVISPPMKRLKQQVLLMVKLEPDKHTINMTETTKTTDWKTGGDEPSNERTETTGTTDG